jgi:hypothetical protein
MSQDKPTARREPWGALAQQLEVLASRPLQPRRAVLRQLAARFRAIAATRPEDRRAV